MLVEGASFDRFRFPTRRVQGGCVVGPFTAVWHWSVELVDRAGRVGVGFVTSPRHPEPGPSADEIRGVFDREARDLVVGRDPGQLSQRLLRHGGALGPSRWVWWAVELAVWDLLGQQLERPLWHLLGGTGEPVPAYASGLEYHLGAEEVAEFLRAARADGFTAFKAKVGFPDLRFEIDRLRMMREVIGPDSQLMVDANRAWTAKEAIRRAWAYEKAGLDIYWLEDPCRNDDLSELARVREAVPFTHLCVGDYLDLDGKRRLLECGATDMLRVHGHLGVALQASWLASNHGKDVVVGNSTLNVGAHSASAMPNVKVMEYSFQGFDQFLTSGISFENGHAVLPTTPGHGIALAPDAKAELRA